MVEFCWIRGITLVNGLPQSCHLVNTSWALECKGCNPQVIESCWDSSDLWLTSLMPPEVLVRTMIWWGDRLSNELFFECTNLILCHYQLTLWLQNFRKVTWFESLSRVEPWNETKRRRGKNMLLLGLQRCQEVCGKPITEHEELPSERKHFLFVVRGRKGGRCI